MDDVVNFDAVVVACTFLPESLEDRMGEEGLEVGVFSTFFIQLFEESFLQASVRSTDILPNEIVVGIQPTQPIVSYAFSGYAFGYFLFRKLMVQAITS